jgi:hypothetical protein
MGVVEKLRQVELREVVEGPADCLLKLTGTTVSGLAFIFGCSARTRALVCASRQSKRRRTVSDRITLRHSLRLQGPRSRLQMLQK